MPHANDICRCVGIRLVDGGIDVCPQSGECARHGDALFAWPGRFPVSQWVCETDQFERRIPLTDD